MEVITRGRQDANTVKLGYYRTDDETVRRIASIVRPATTDGSATNQIFDPCCGEGIALSQLAQAWGNTRSWGIEYDAQRFTKASECIDEVIHGDALSDTWLSSGWAGFSLFNPPYGPSKDNQGLPTRLESLFWEKHAGRVIRGGVMVAILPRVLFACAPGLMRAMSIYFAGNRVEIYACPTQQYHQIVVIGYHRTDTTLGQNKALYERLLEVGTGKYVPLAIPQAIPEPFMFPAGRVPDSFESLNMTEESVRVALRHESSDGLRQVETDLIAQRATHARHPSVMPLRQGHIPILLAAGGLDGVVSDAHGSFLVKGSVKRVASERKDEDTTEDSRGNSTTRRVTTTRYQWQTRIMAWDLTPGRNYPLVNIE